MKSVYEELAEAIVLRAVSDYRESNNLDTLWEIEQFFRSEWFKVLTKIDGKYLIHVLRKEKENGCKRIPFTSQIH